MITIARKDVVQQIKNIHHRISSSPIKDWTFYPLSSDGRSRFVPVGLFLKDGFWRVEEICESFCIGSTMLGYATIMPADEDADHSETADMLLYDISIGHFDAIKIV